MKSLTHSIVVTDPDKLRDLLREALLEAHHEMSQTPPSAAQEAPSERIGDWVTQEQALTLTGLSRSTLQRLRTSAQLPYSKVRNRIYYRITDLESLLEQHIVSGGSSL